MTAGLCFSRALIIEEIGVRLVVHQKILVPNRKNGLKPGQTRSPKLAWRQIQNLPSAQSTLVKVGVKVHSRLTFDSHVILEISSENLTRSWPRPL